MTGYPDSRKCPNWAVVSLKRWAQDAIPPGDFLVACLENNLKEAVGRADRSSLESLHHIVAYLYNEMPGLAWGSPARVKAWSEAAG